MPSSTLGTNWGLIDQAIQVSQHAAERLRFLHTNMMRLVIWKPIPIGGGDRNDH